MNSFMLILTFLPLGGIAKLIIVARTFKSLHHINHITRYKKTHMPDIDLPYNEWMMNSPNDHFSTQLPEFLL